MYHVFGIHLRIFKNDYHIFAVVRAGVIEALKFVSGVDGWRSTVLFFANCRTTADGTSKDQTTNLEQQGTGKSNSIKINNIIMTNQYAVKPICSRTYTRSDPYAVRPICSWTHMQLDPHVVGPICSWTHTQSDPHAIGLTCSRVNMQLDQHVV